MGVMGVGVGVMGVGVGDSGPDPIESHCSLLTN